MSRLNKGLDVSGTGFSQIGYHEGHSVMNSPGEIVGMGWRVIDDCTSLDEEVQHNRTPFGDTHPLRGTGSV